MITLTFERCAPFGNDDDGDGIVVEQRYRVVRYGGDGSGESCAAGAAAFAELFHAYRWHALVAAGAGAGAGAAGAAGDAAADSTGHASA